MSRTDAAYGLAILLREICEEVSIYSFSDQAKRVRVAALPCVTRSMAASTTKAPAWEKAAAVTESHDRLMLIPSATEAVRKWRYKPYLCRS